MTLKEYLPNYYKGIREFEALMQIEDELLAELQIKLQQVKMNQWIQTADEQTIRYQEELFHILPNPLIETLAFRKQRIILRMHTRPPFTLRYLQEQLNQIFREVSYQLKLEADSYLLILETAAKNAAWFHEVQTLIYKVKPANIQYIQLPVITERIHLQASASISTLAFFRVGESRVGRDPLVHRLTEEEVILQ
ncbi:DUF2313 domain-containing protein [Listeria monocytogenes]|uniref:putative phage tail protein n=1 Tax=Listeria monocytogenes TaxID=1639 RepID=UPI000F2CAAAE|nr:putative phage tail protein [Listeria monocytogenes]EJC6460082.1 DUF2313 domain-containing protein [Listeria monocytogenes]EJT8453796.1 DUF2313 domain-containing protein [Listeria monocytogenes]EKZ7015260.1 DUF2313 domain-containing protein [Listeria monocytogenes]MCM64435.1 hypothetical protein [Listeria monocytogenes]TYU82161.1 DUF2313 domain-containing protein [Listeria monocytogenes]